MTRIRALGRLRLDKPVVVIVVVAFGLRLGWLLLARPEPVSDYLVYQRLAENLLDNGTFGLVKPTAIQMPGMPAFLAATMLISRSTLWLSFITVILSTAACVPVYLLARRLTGREAMALVASATYAVLPTFVLYAPVLGTEQLFTLLMLSALLVALAVQPGDIGRPLLAGVLTGVAALTRGEAVFYAPLILGIVWWGTRGFRRPQLRAGALVVVGTVLAVTPWVVRNAIVIQPGLNLSSVGGVNFYFGHNPDHYGWAEEVPWDWTSESDANSVGWRVGLEYVRDHPLSIVTSVVKGTYQQSASPDYALYWSTQRPVGDRLDFEARSVPLYEELGKALPALAALALSLAAASVLLWRRWPPLLRLVVGGVVVLNWMGYVLLFFGHPRFRYFVDVILTTLVGLVLVTLWEHRRPDEESVGREVTV